MRMFGFSTRGAIVAAGLLACGLVAGSAAPAMADAAPAPQICASGAMTITRDGPTVYDGVDCTPAAAPAQVTASAPPAAKAVPPAAPAAPAAAPASPAAEPVVAATPSNTELRPVQPAAAVDIVPVTPVAVTPVATTSSHSSPLSSEAEAAAAVLAMLGAAIALLPIARRRRVTAVAEGLD